MKKITSILLVLFISMVAVFAIPKPKDIYRSTSNNFYCVYWQLDSIPENSDISVATVSCSNTDILELDDNGKITNKRHDINISNPEIIYLIAKYGYVIIAAPNECPVLETEIDFGYVAYELDWELEEED